VPHHKVSNKKSEIQDLEHAAEFTICEMTFVLTSFLSYARHRWMKTDLRKQFHLRFEVSPRVLFDLKNIKFFLGFALYQWRVYQVGAYTST